MLKTKRRYAFSGEDACSWCDTQIPDLVWRTYDVDEYGYEYPIKPVFCGQACKQASWRWDKKYDAYLARRQEAREAGLPFSEVPPDYGAAAKLDGKDCPGCGESYLEQEDIDAGARLCALCDPRSWCHECWDALEYQDKNQSRRVCGYCVGLDEIETQEDIKRVFWQIRTCAACCAPIDPTRRADVKTCSPKCRRALSRRKVGTVEATGLVAGGRQMKAAAV